MDLTDNHSPALSSLVNIRSVALNFFLWDFTVLAFLLFLIINHFLFPKVPNLVFILFQTQNFSKIRFLLISRVPNIFEDKEIGKEFKNN